MTKATKAPRAVRLLDAAERGARGLESSTAATGITLAREAGETTIRGVLIGYGWPRDRLWLTLRRMPPLTTGDLEYDPGTNTWRPIGAPAIPPYQAGGVAATAVGPAPDPQVREQMRKELRLQGLPLPPHLADSEAADAEQLQALQGGHAAPSRTSDELGEGPTVIEGPDVIDVEGAER